MKLMLLDLLAVQIGNLYDVHADTKTFPKVQ